MKKVGITARVSAVILAAGMIMTDINPALAAQTAHEGAVVEMEEQVRASEKGISKVIGLKGRPSARTIVADDGRTKADYTYVNLIDDSVVLKGQKENLLDPATGLYKNGTDFYESAENKTASLCELSGKVQVIASAPQGATWQEINATRPQTDGYGFYQMNGNSYFLSSRSKQNDTTYAYDYYVWYIRPDNALEVAVLPAGADAYATYGKKLVPTDPVNYSSDYDWYEMPSGKRYNSIYSQIVTKVEGGVETEQRIVYAYASNEISFEKKTKLVSWQPLSNVTEIDSNGKRLYIGYQVKVDDQVVNDLEMIGDTAQGTIEKFTREESYVSLKAYAAGESSTYQVRGVYYTETENAVPVYEMDEYGRPVIDPATNQPKVRYYKTETVYNIVKTGEWSEPYAYAWTQATKTLPQVTGVSVKANSAKNYELTWGAVPDAYGYEIEFYKSTAPVADWTAVKDSDWSELDYVSASKTYYEFSRGDLNLYTKTEYVQDDVNGSFYQTEKGKYVSAASSLYTFRYDEEEDEYLRFVNGVQDGTVSYWSSRWSKYDESASYVSYYDDDDDIVYVKVMPGKFAEVKKPVTNVYFRVCAVVNSSATEFTGQTGAWSAPVELTAGIAEETQILPDITGLKVEKNDDGSFYLVWNPVDEDTRIRLYYTKDQSAFATPAYTYELANPYAEVNENGSMTTYYLTEADSLRETLNILNNKVSYHDYTGVSEVSSSDLGLEVNETYYFSVVVYDSTKRDTQHSVPYTANVFDSATGGMKPISYLNYTDVKEAAKISAKRTMVRAINQPSTKSDKTSITLTFEDKTSAITGYEISRADKKGKYKKIATTNSAQFADRGLAQSTVYSYRVRAYNYNTVTKKTYYSDYVYFQAETSVNNYLNLKVKEASKSSVKLNWTKVANAKSYEIYRTSTFSEDTDVSKVSGYGNGIVYGNQKWELVKTIKKAKTVSYTDKKLASGVTYIYKVVANYKEGKKTKQIFSTDGVTLKLQVPRNLTAVGGKSTVSVTWDADKYATKYEVRYIKYNAQGKAETTDWVKASTKKASYSIKNVADGGSVTVKVRAYGSSKWTEFTEEVGASGKYLTAAGSVTAKNTTVKDAKGASHDAIQVSWKKVSGAAYYMVYRSTSPSDGYNNVYKYNYGSIGDWELISKESNDDERIHTVPYREYKNINGTIVDTKAIDRGNLQQGVTYYYYVIAYAANGSNMTRGFTEPAAATFKATPGIKSVKAAKGKVTVTINRVAGAKSYEVYRSTKKDKDYELIGTTKTTKYTDKKAKKNKTYYYKVVACGTNALKADMRTELSAPSKKVKAK